jgi:hypothetical protein
MARPKNPDTPAPKQILLDNGNMQITVEREITIQGYGIVKSNSKVVEVPQVKAGGTIQESLNDVLQLFSGTQVEQMQELIWAVNAAKVRQERKAVVTSFGMKVNSGSALAEVRRSIAGFVKTLKMSETEAAKHVLDIPAVKDKLKEEGIEIHLTEENVTEEVEQAV